MSAKKKKAGSELGDIHSAIKDILASLKPKLRDGKLASGRADLIDQLYALAALAQSFSKQRPRSHKDWQALADSLDGEGVTLWNASALVRHQADPDARTLLAALRLAGFRLIEAGLEHRPSVETLAHVLQLASKTGATLSESGNRDAAASVLASAAALEESLRNAEDPQAAHAQARVHATAMYYCTRMEAAWREGNDGVAHFMAQKISENDHARLALLLPRDREDIAAKLLQIGKSLLRGPEPGGGADSGANVSANRAQDSVKWLQRAFAMVEPLEDKATPGVAELKRSILRSLARAYFLASALDPENLTRAEAALHELIASIDAGTDGGGSPEEYQQLRWMRLAVLKRRKAGDAVLLECFHNIVDHMRLAEADVADVLQEVRTLGRPQHALVTAVTAHCIQRALGAPGDAGLPFVGKLLLAHIFHLAKCDGDNHARAIEELENAFTGLVVETSYDLPKVPAAACLTLLWQNGERAYQTANFAAAADWFLISTHKLFASVGQASSAKCFRKAALCYIRMNEYARAANVVRRCSQNDAATQYVLFLAAAHQGLEEEAICAVENMVNAPDFDRKMLLLATQLAHKSEMRTLLLAVLEALLVTLQNRGDANTEIEAVTICRCSIRLVGRLLEEPLANQRALLERLIRQFRTVQSLVDTIQGKQGIAMISKEVSWLWRTAYNTAVQGCTQWQDAVDIVSELFDIARSLLETYCQSAVEVNPELYVNIVHATFSATAGRVFALRQDTAAAAQSTDRLQATVAHLSASKARIQAILTAGHINAPDEVSRTRSFIHVLRVFEVELQAQVLNWDAVLEIVHEVIQSDQTAANTFEAIADVLWTEKACPVDVLYTTLEGLLRANLDQNNISLTKFSRWLRGICTILLARNQDDDRVKALGYIDQAVAVLQDQAQSGQLDAEDYPLDERMWLMTNAYNTGIECLHASLLDEARRWFEISTVMCRFIPDGQARADEISDTYTRLLARYSNV